MGAVEIKGICNHYIDLKLVVIRLVCGGIQAFTDVQREGDVRNHGI